MIRITSVMTSFLPSRMRPEIRELYLSTLILNFGISMILIFEPIYLYTLGYSLHQIILFFLMVYGVYFFIMPIGAKFARHFGFEHSMFVSTLAFIGYYLIFYNIATMPWLFFVAPVLYALQKTFYWPAFHADFANYANVLEEGREVGGLDTVVLSVAVAAPLIAGLIVKFSGFSTLFIVVSIVFLISNIPLLSTKEVFVPKTFPYLLAYKNLFSRENRRAVFSYLGYGEELIALVVWPIFMVTIIKDYLNIGTIAALATLITVIVTLYVGRMTDLKNKRGVLRFGTIVYAFVWFLRTSVQTAWGVFFVDTLSRLSKEMVSVPLISLTYERAQQRSVMQTVVLYEMSLVVGKLLALIGIYALLFLIPDAIVYQVVFVIAGLMTLLYTVI